MPIYSYYLKEEREITPISSFQPLMIVKFREGPNFRNKGSGFCIFETSIFANKDRLKLNETETFSQLLLYKVSDLYTVDFESEDDVKKVQLDLTVFSGDIKFKIDDQNIEKEANKYFLANKIFYSIQSEHLNGKKKVEFRVVIEKNSFYTISYQLIKTGEENINIRESEFNFVESASFGEYEKNYKLIYLLNLRTDVGTPFLASFYSRICKFSIISYDEPEYSRLIKTFGEFSQVIINEGDIQYYNDKYVFKIQSFPHDSSYYDKKVCILYFSSLELEKNNTIKQSTISLSEGVPHSFIFSRDFILFHIHIILLIYLMQ